jgi:hypothetical protein
MSVEHFPLEKRFININLDVEFKLDYPSIEEHKNKENF